LLRAVLQGRQAFVSFSISNIIEALAKALLGVGFVQLGFGLGGAIAGYTIGTAASVIYTLVVVRRQFSPRGEGAVRFDRTRLYETAAGAAASSGAITVLAYADVLLVKHFFIPETAGLFGVISLIGKMIFLGVAFVPVVILPKATEVATQGRNPGPLLLQAGAIMAAVAAGALGCVYLFGPAIVAIVSGGAYVGAARYLFAYTAAMSLLSAANIVITFKVGLHRFDFVAPTLLVVAGEVIAISLFHDSLRQVVTIVLAGHALAFFGSLYRLTAPPPARAA
jgi:O-antigen/teichoic acid export membrane protein